MTIVQTCAGNVALTVNANGTPIAISQAFPSNVTAGHPVLVFLGADTDNVSFTAFSSLHDTQGNSYTQIFNFDHSGFNAPPGLGAFFCASAAGGPNTLTGNFATSWGGFGSHVTTFNLYIIAVEFTGISSVQSFADAQNHNLFPVNLTLAISTGASVTVTANSSSPNNGWGLVDLFGAGTDNLFAGGILAGNASPPNSPGSDTFSSATAQYGKGTLVTDTPTTGSAIEYLALYKLGPSRIQQPQVYVIT